MIEPSKRGEFVFTSLMLIVSLLLAVNFDPIVGGFYFSFTVIYWIGLLTRAFDDVEIHVARQALGAVVLSSLFILVLWVSSSMWLWSQTSGQVSFGFTPGHFASFFKVLGSEAQMPVLISNPVVNFIVFGQYVPIAESLFALSFLIVLFSVWVFKTPIRWHDPQSKFFKNMIMVCLLVGMVMSMFHLSIRYIRGADPTIPFFMFALSNADVALFVDMMFFSISAFMVFLSASPFNLVGGDSKPNMARPLSFHTLTNSIVSLLR